jgi:lysophospholipase L1-like esterase
VALACIEFVLRGAAAVLLGPGSFFYGTQIDRRELGGVAGEPSYSKYNPGQMRFDRDINGNIFKVVANNQGFRGPDFTREKPPRTLRIVTLGASSTFGYRNRNDETYSYYLEKDLEDADLGTRVEVINLGIPHLTSEEIYQLFVSEALVLHPDIVTFYAGANDTRAVEPLPGLRHWALSAARHLVTVALVTEFSMALVANAGYSADHLDAQANLIVRHYVDVLESLANDCRERNIIFIPATEQMTSTQSAADRAGLTYDAEVAQVRERLNRTHEIPIPGMRLLVHAELTARLRDWAHRRGLDVADVLGALDGHRDLLVSWVHLAPEGNRIVAQTLARTILAGDQRRALARSAPEP